MSINITRTYVCSDFMERVRSNVCHICLQPETAHPTDDDRAYWAQSLVSEVLRELCRITCVHKPLDGYPHASDCVGCRIEKTCTKCGHYVDMLSKHR